MSSSKRKAVPTGGGPSTKKLTGAYQSALVQGSQEHPVTAYRKPSKSNNRREWMKECLKLLETMIELPDSKPFREPVDCLKYPDFYAQVEDPIDFSKVMLKFRGGQYQDPFDFEKDVRQLFTDYKGFFKDPSTEVYAQTHRLSYWFESEFRRILEKYGDKLKKKQESMSPLAASTDPASRTSPKQNTNIMVSINNGSCTIMQSPPERSSVAGLMSDMMYPAAWHQSKNYQVVQQIMPPLSSSSASPGGARSLHPPFAPPPPHTLAAATHEKLYAAAAHGLPLGAAVPGAPSPPWTLDQHAAAAAVYEAAAEKRASFSASRVHNSSFEMGSELQVAVPPNLYTRSLDRDNYVPTPDERFNRQFPGLQHVKSASLDVGYRLSPGQHSTGSGSAGGRLSPQHEYDRCSHHSMSPTPRRTPTPTPPTVRVTSPTNQSSDVTRPVPMMTERAASDDSNSSVTTLVGMKLEVCNVWLGSVRGKATKPIILHEHGLKIPFYYRDTETTLHIKVEEIVRCLGHLGKNKKHTILLFVTPSCVQRIERRVRVRDTDASLIALFLTALSTANISRLLHTFHNMGKNSLFGTSLFSEVDQPSILRMLANIKPDINEKMKNSKLNSGAGGGGNTNGGGSSRNDAQTAATLSVPDTDHPMRSRSLPESNEPPPSASVSPMDQGALDLSTPRPSIGSFQSGSVDHPALPVGVGNSTTTIKSTTITHTHTKGSIPKAYKPKFHFRSNSYLVRQNSTTIEPHFDSGMGSSSEDSASTPRPPLRKLGSADSSCESNESATSGSEAIRKEEDPESDLDLDYDEEETLGRSSHSVLLVVDSNDEELTTINPDEDDHDLPRREMSDLRVSDYPTPPAQPALNTTSLQQHTAGGPGQLRAAYVPGSSLVTAPGGGALVPMASVPSQHMVRNPYCGHAYERQDVLHLIKDQGVQARCPMKSCSNDRPLRIEDMIPGYDIMPAYSREPVAR